ncbi:MAG: response regulator [Candidatus Poseidoniales archaeon]
MARVTEVDDIEAPTVLLVDNNQMALHRLSTIFRQREFKVVTCDDGDKAVDEYIRLDPELVVMSLDIPSMDGHLAALEMREHGKDCRILFCAPKRQAQLAHDATHSAGAIGWVEKPITAAAIESIWDLVLGPIPEAPGLQDLDTIHPVDDLIEIEADIDPTLLPALPVLPMPINPLPVTEKTSSKKRSSKGKRLLAVMLIFTTLAAAGWYAWSSGLI